MKSWFLRNIARPQPTQDFLPQIDGLRFVAIMAVLLYHIQGFVAVKSGLENGQTAGFFQRILGEGNYGVPLFFALSGFIICKPFLGGRQVSLRQYFTRRLTRLEPPYVISLLLVFAVKISALSLSLPELFPNLMASLIYSHNLIYGTPSLVNGVAWSLEVEWQFYVLAPLIFWIVIRSAGIWRHAGLLALVGLGGWAYMAGFEADQRISLSILSYFGFFIAGVWVAVVEVEAPTWGRDSLAMDLVGIAGWTGIAVALLGGRRYAPFLPLLTGLVVLSGLRGYGFRTVLGWWPIYCIGGMCYTIYLYHFFVVSAVGRVFGTYAGWPGDWDHSLLLFSLVSVPIVLLSCAIPYLLIERPFMIWRPGRNRLVAGFRSPT